MKPVTVNGIRYKPGGVASEAFRYTFDAPALHEDAELREWNAGRLAAFVKAMPERLARDTAAACDALAARIREHHALDGDDPAAGISEAHIAELPDEDLDALVGMYGLRDLADAAGSDADLDARARLIRRALVAARNRGWDAAERSNATATDEQQP